ncbi:MULTISPECIES: AlpA family transcriptional regulator [unclassified Phenylobacterium]|uniref:helix-turn-helix transcriptional regulator n=1 Tax=unclassified Phenylobacterium TaxID=2640670 RepID=UPI0009EAB43C|nr:MULTISPECIES: AlpA family phage regulatory protein [unclassified Phenylobacterium]
MGCLIAWKEVARRTSLSRTTAWRLQQRGDFPMPYAISPGRVGYRESEIAAWQASRDDRRAPWPEPPVAGRSSEPEPPSAAKGVPEGRPTPPPPRPAARQSPRRRSQHAKAIAQQMRFDF